MIEESENTAREFTYSRGLQYSMSAISCVLFILGIITVAGNGENTVTGLFLCLISVALLFPYLFKTLWISGNNLHHKGLFSRKIVVLNSRTKIIRFSDKTDIISDGITKIIIQREIAGKAELMDIIRQKISG